MEGSKISFFLPLYIGFTNAFLHCAGVVDHWHTAVYRVWRRRDITSSPPLIRLLVMESGPGLFPFCNRLIADRTSCGVMGRLRGSLAVG